MIAVDKRLAVLSLILLALTACGRKASEPAREHPAASSTNNAASDYEGVDAQQSGDRPDPRKAPVPKVDGKPMWTANRRYTAQENAQRHFERDGESFDAKTADDYVKKAHAFVTRPPKAAQTLKRANGDTLIYDGDSNTFAVATKDGAPRTMFKPRTGAEYWEQQKEREKSGGSSRQARSRRTDSGDEG